MQKTRQKLRTVLHEVDAKTLMQEAPCAGAGIYVCLLAQAASDLESNACIYAIYHLQEIFHTPRA